MARIAVGSNLVDSHHYLHDLGFEQHHTTMEIPLIVGLVAIAIAIFSIGLSFATNLTMQSDLQNANARLIEQESQIAQLSESDSKMREDIVMIESTLSSQAEKKILFTDVSPKFIKYNQLLDDAKGNAAGWTPNGQQTVFQVEDSNVAGNSIVIITLPQGAVPGTICAVGQIIPLTSFRMSCNIAPVESAALNYVVIIV